VLVFFHGGADEFGAANEPVFDGAALAARGDAVVVSVDYRLGLFGWTELGGLDRRYAGSGNNGLRDQIAALTWVRHQIRGFGGDPGEVTVFGQSAGAVSISALLAGDHPERLFRRAIIESGSGYQVHTGQYARDAAAHLLAAGTITSIGQLTAMSTQQLLQVQLKAQQGVSGLADALFFGPSIDGTLIPGPVLDRIAAGSARGVDLMVGSTENAAERPRLTALSRDMMDAWSGFARTGRPGWPDYTPAARATKIWDVPEQVVTAPQDAERAMWDAYSFPAWDLEPWSGARESAAHRHQ
jgi:para-nitrobenzyl esterase